jgi:lactoylglutathione lyase
MFTTAFVNLYTADIEAALTFYRDLLGFEETFRTPEQGSPQHVELTLNGFALGLGTVEAAKAAHGVDASPGSPAMALVVWTDDVDAAFANLKSAGAHVLRSPRDSGNSNRNALVRDPDGNLVEIVAKVDRRV